MDCHESLILTMKKKAWFHGSKVVVNVNTCILRIVLNCMRGMQIPDVRWRCIFGLEYVRKNYCEMLVESIQDTRRSQSFSG